MESEKFEHLIAHPEIEEKYAGECIAIVEDKVAAHGKDLRKVLEETEKRLV